MSENSSNSKPGTSTVPQGHYFKFHRGQFCPGCDFKNIALNAGVLSHLYIPRNFRGSTGKSLLTELFSGYQAAIIQL